MDNLDNNLLGEILIRLPPKTLGQLKLINKRWYSFISDPSFVNKHTSLQTKTCNLFLSYSNTGGDVFQLSFDPSSPGRPLTKTIISLDLPKELPGSSYCGGIVASCHGLLLVEFSDYIYTFNPLTKKRHLIPSSGCGSLSCRYGLAFRTTSSPSYHYNVVCLYTTNTSFAFKIFDPEHGCWRDSNKTSMISYRNGLKSRSVFTKSCPVWFRGNIHWLTDEGYIIAFNLDKEESKVIEIPKSLSEIITTHRNNWFGVVEDEVNLVVVTPEHEIVIWVLHDYENKNWKIKRKDAIQTKINGIVYIRIMFFDGERLVLLILAESRFGNFKSHWQEHDIKTGVSRPLSFNLYCEWCFPDISTLTTVWEGKPSSG